MFSPLHLIINFNNNNKTRHNHRSATPRRFQHHIEPQHYHPTTPNIITRGTTCLCITGSPTLLTIHQPTLRPWMHSPLHQRQRIHPIQQQNHHHRTPLPNNKTLAHPNTNTEHQLHTIHQQCLPTKHHHQRTHRVLPRMLLLPSPFYMVHRYRRRPLHHMARTHIPTRPTICPRIHCYA